MDTISTGLVIAFAMECYDRGLITASDADGLELRWGDPDVIIEMVKKIARREGLGNLLAEGVKRAAEEIGGGAERFAAHVKGLELPMHEPRGKKGVGLMYAVASRGSVHTDAAHDTGFDKPDVAPELGLTKAYSRFDLEGKPEMIAKMRTSGEGQEGMAAFLEKRKPKWAE